MKASVKTENKLLILYFMEKMDIPLSNNQIEMFALSGNYMDFFALQEALNEMVNAGHIETYKETTNNTLRHNITDAGLASLDYFVNLIAPDIRVKVNQYILDHRKSIKRDYETTANYFKDLNSADFTVKCALYEDSAMLMEINLSVVSVEQAKLICDNWKNNITTLYGSILSKLITIEKEDNPEE